MQARHLVMYCWFGLLTLLWVCQPLLVSSARGILVLALLAGLCALLGGITGAQPLVIWSGGIGLFNLTMALLLTSAPPSLWLGLSAGVTLLALLDAQQSLTYLRHCQVAPGVLATFSRTLLRLSGLSLAAGIGVGYLVVALHSTRMDTQAAGYVTILGAAIFVGFFAVFLLRTARLAALKTPDDWGETGDSEIR